VLPANPELLIFFQNGQKLPDNDKLRTLFEKEYSASFYQAGIKNLEAQRQAIYSIFPTLIDFHNRWNFQVFPEYSIQLTRFGPGGFCDAESAIIQLMTREDGTFKRPHPGHTVIHEIVHIGVEKNIVRRFDLTHAEKEGLVDRICLLSFPKVLLGYKVQDNADRNIFNYITSESMLKLPEAVEQFKANQQR
jgi:hypothetical protein